MIVVDASAMVDWLTGSENAADLRSHLDDADVLAAPELVLPECTSAIWRLVRADVLTGDTATRLVQSLETVPLDLVSHRSLISRAWSHRHAIRISDAFYMATAQELGVPLLTTDRRLARAAEGLVALAR